MMDLHNVETARDARRDQAIKDAKCIIDALTSRTQLNAAFKADLREIAEHLLQCVHEFLAYENVIEGPKAGKGKRVKE